MRCTPYPRGQGRTRPRLSRRSFRCLVPDRASSFFLFLPQCPFDLGDVALVWNTAHIGHAVFFVGPGAEIEQLASFGAERPELVPLVLRFLPAGWTLNYCHNS